MKNKLHNFFSENNFDILELDTNHIARFERKLNHKKSNNRNSWKVLSAAASIVLVIGFWLGSASNKKQLDLADVSPKMEEVQNYFVSTIHQELITLEKNRNLENEFVIEQALEKLEELEDNYRFFIIELSKKNNERKIIQAMIGNYQKRLEILENVLKHIEIVKNPQLINDEIFI